ncbi:MAG: hypothetical protein HOV66_22725, partial [Streptomycetaceae bacterium]|nr:hypothetical protein [Streptomycetaceae bacterium]
MAVSWSEIEPLLANRNISESIRKRIAVNFGALTLTMNGFSFAVHDGLQPYLDELGVSMWDVWSNGLTNLLDYERDMWEAVADAKTQLNAQQAAGTQQLAFDVSGIEDAELTKLIADADTVLNARLALCGSGTPVTGNSGNPQGGATPGNPNQGTAATTYEQLSDEQRKTLQTYGFNDQKVRGLVSQSKQYAEAVRGTLIFLHAQMQAEIDAAKPNLSNQAQKTKLIGLIKTRLAQAEDHIRNAVTQMGNLQDRVPPNDPNPGEAKPGDAKPGDTKPGDGQPGDTKPEDAKPGDTKPGDAKPGETDPGEAVPNAPTYAAPDATYYGSPSGGDPSYDPGSGDYDDDSPGGGYPDDTRAADDNPGTDGRPNGDATTPGAVTPVSSTQPTSPGSTTPTTTTTTPGGVTNPGSTNPFGSTGSNGLEDMMLPMLMSQLMGGDTPFGKDDAEPEPDTHDDSDREHDREKDRDTERVPAEPAPSSPAQPGTPGEAAPKDGDPAKSGEQKPGGPPSGATPPAGAAAGNPAQSTTVALPDGRTVTAPSADAAKAVAAALAQTGDIDARQAYQGTGVKPPSSDDIAFGKGWGAKVDPASLQPGDVGIWKDGRMVMFGAPGMIIAHGALRPLTDAGMTDGFTGFYRPSATPFSDTSIGAVP